MCIQNLKFLALPVPEIIGGALPVPEIIGGIQKIGQSLDMPTPPCLQIFLRLFARIEPANVPAKFEGHSFKRS